MTKKANLQTKTKTKNNNTCWTRDGLARNTINDYQLKDVIRLRYNISQTITLNFYMKKVEIIMWSIIFYFRQIQGRVEFD